MVVTPSLPVKQWIKVSYRDVSMKDPTISDSTLIINYSLDVLQWWWYSWLHAVLFLVNTPTSLVRNCVSGQGKVDTLVSAGLAAKLGCRTYISWFWQDCSWRAAHPSDTWLVLTLKHRAILAVKNSSGGPKRNNSRLVRQDHNSQRSQCVYRGNYSSQSPVLAPPPVVCCKSQQSG